jgi:hypothetical protein
MMMKDFDTWNVKKKQLDAQQSDAILFFKEGEVWWVHFGLNIGFEMNGKGNEFTRPVLIIKNNISQMKNIDSRRLVKKMCTMERSIFKDIQRKTSRVNFG